MNKLNAPKKVENMKATNKIKLENIHNELKFKNKHNDNYKKIISILRNDIKCCEDLLKNVVDNKKYRNKLSSESNNHTTTKENNLKLNISNYNIEKDFSGIGVITVKNSKQHTRKNSLLKENSIINFSLENSFITNNMIASKNLSELTTPGNKIIFDRMIQKNNPVEDAKLKYNLKNFYERGNNLKKNIPLKLVSNKMNIQLDFEKVKEKIKCRTSLNSGNNSNHHSNSVSINRKINGKMNEHQIQESNLNTESKNVPLNKIKVDDINYQTKTNSNSKLYSKSIGHTRKNSNIKDELLIEQFNSNIGSRILSLDSSDSLIESDVNKLQKNKLSQIREIIYEILSTPSNIKETFSQDYSSALEILKNYINIQNTNLEIKSKEFNDKIFNLVEQNLILKVKYYFKYNLRMKMKNLTTNSENLIK